MSSRLETRQLQELIPQYAAKYTDEKWEYYYSENVDSVMGHIEQYSKQDVIGWDVTANGAEEELRPGVMHICPKGLEHSIINTGEEDLVMLTIVVKK